MRHPMAPTRAARAGAVLLGVGLLAPAAAHASARAADDPSCDRGAPEVIAVRFVGNRALPAAALDSAIATHPTAWVRRTLRLVGTRRCLAAEEEVRDQVRLLLLYRRRGWTRATVVPQVEPAGRGRVRLRFAIAEGEPLRVGDVVVSGGDEAQRAAARRVLPVAVGQPVDRDRLALAREAAELALHEQGYLRARVDTAVAAVRTVGDSLQATVTFALTPGPLVTVGGVRVLADPAPGRARRVSDAEARRLTGLSTGTVLRESALLAARRRLADAGLFQQVVVRPAFEERDVDGDAAPAAFGATAAVSDSVAELEVRLVEGLRHELRAEAGWATFDCGRAQLAVERAGTIRPAGRLSLVGRVSKLGVGRPANLAPGLCAPPVRDDPYSQRLNYRAAATYRHPSLGPRGAFRTAALFSERRGEYLAFERTTFVGASAQLARPLLGRRGTAWTATLGYDLSYGRTRAEPTVLCGTFSACLPAERDRLQQARPFGVASAALTRGTTDDLADPTRGALLRVELRGASRWLGSNVREQFAGARADLSHFRPVGRGAVLAARLQGGLVGAAGGDYVPQQERLFAGGPNSIRGFRQNLVGPRVYLPDTIRVREVGGQLVLDSDPSQPARAIPTGGDGQLLGSVELRLRPPLGPALVQELVQVVPFVDAGAVWDRSARGADAGWRGLRVTPGLGLRAFTPVGPVRVDVGYNDYGARAGAAYRGLARTDAGAQPLYCVSPGNALPLTVPPGGAVPVQAQGPCPATFAPARPRGIGERLTLHLSIGQAF